MVTSVTSMEVRNEVTEVILQITLEIIHLLTGEDYTIVKKKSGARLPSTSNPNISAGMEKSPPQSMIHEKNNEQKILELTNKIIELLSGEVPIRCQDIAVYFSMEELEYIEEHKDQYQDHQRLPPPGGSQKKLSCLTSKSNKTSEDEEMETSENVTEVLCDEGSDSTFTNIVEEPVSGHRESFRDPDMHPPTDHVQHPAADSISIPTDDTEGSVLYEEENHQDTDMCADPNPIQHVPSPCIKEEPVSCHEDNHHIPDIYPASHPVQHVPLPCIKEEPVSCDEEDLPFPADPRPYDPSPYVKEEPTSCDEDLADDNRRSLSDYLQCPPDIKEEPVSSEEDFAEHHSDLSQYSASHVKEEPTSSDDRYTFASHTLEHQYAYIKKEPDCDYRGTNAHPEIYNIRSVVPCPSPYIKEEPSSCGGGGGITYPSSNAPTYCTQQYLSTCIKKEPSLFNERDFPQHISYHIKCPSKPVKEETSCPDNGRYLSSLPCGEPVTSHLRFFKETTLSSSSERTHNLSPTSVKEDVALRHPDVKTENSPSPMKVIVLAHLVDVDTEGRHNSQGPQCTAGTSSRVRHDLKDSRLSFLSRPRTMKTGATFGDISNLTKYLRTHSKKKTPQCPECGKYFLRKILLNDHLRMHAKQRSVQCAEVANISRTMFNF
ncbi:uncharacterized protein [Engystomops pustulosus]|uniref:uncharacterized protein n=1 Tax=Engystomops pustulosus TaxID=76066 RepID=UPI003AFA4A5E